MAGRRHDTSWRAAVEWHNATVITTAVFDVNETMLDLSDLDPHFARVFGSDDVRGEWFSLVLRNALTLTIVGEYRDFGSVAGASLEMIAAVHGVELGEPDRAAVVATMRSLAPHPDVAPSLERLRSSGLQLVALTNSPPDIAEQQLINADLARYFDHMLSVHPTGKFKPHPDVYRHAANQVGEALHRMMMIAAHDWDIAGAMAVGMAGAYVTRQGMTLNPLFQQPTLTADTMDAIVGAILASRER